MAPAARATDARRLDAVAVDAALRRLRHQAEAPWLHGEVARRLGERLTPLRIQPIRVLDWWAAVGGGRAALRQRFPEAEIVAVENGGGWPPRVADAKRFAWPFGRKRDGARPSLLVQASDGDLGVAQLVWANMMLHFVVDPPALFARWHGLLGAEGVVAFSCPGPSTLRELRSLYAAAGWPAPTPGYVDMHDLGDMMVGAGFAEPVLDQETITLRWGDAESLLRELAQLGGNTAPDRYLGLRTPRWRRRLLAALAESADSHGRIGLGFEIAYGHGFKVAARQRSSEPTTVSLEAMRDLARRPNRDTPGAKPR
ncbi:MAG: biotin synthase [Pseudomonadota bacterium]|nr:biotin synthase [Pseudomonadota bacterium]